MRRDITRLTTHTFDVLVIGGGIYGLIIACDSAMRGLSVALIERNDFGSGASFNHLRTIHGGLRYLQTLDLARARESIRERRTLARIAAPFVQLQPFVLPLSASVMRGSLAMRAGFLLDAIIGTDRNRAIPDSHRVPAGRILDRRETVDRFPPLRASRFRRAALWYDYITTDADRLSLSWGLAADKHGAVLVNYVEAVNLRIEGDRAIGAHAFDRLDQHAVEIRARVIVNATGGAIDRLLEREGIAVGVPMLKAMNLVTSRDAPPAALGGHSASGRTLFQVPWKGRALFGTWESTAACAPDDLSIDESDVAQFIKEINAAFSTTGLTRSDVTLVHRGVVPAVRRSDGSVRLQGHEQVFDHADTKIEGLISVAGTKYTTARAVAERVTDRILTKLGRGKGSCRTAENPLPTSDASGDARLVAAARDEMAVTLEDAVIRRTPLGALGCPADETLRHAADVVGSVLGWDQQKKDREIAAVRRFYGTSKA